MIYYTTVDGTAKAGSDYTRTSGSFRLSMEGEITIPLVEDKSDEPEEEFFVHFTGSGWGHPARAVIRDDDEPADLSITITPQGTSLTRIPFTYMLRVDNAGPGTATDVVLTAPLPNSATLLSVAVSQGTWTTSSPTVIASLGTIHSGASATVSIAVVFTTASQVSLTASASAAQSDPSSANNTATVVLQAFHGEPIPTLHPLLILLLAALLAATGVLFTRR